MTCKGCGKTDKLIKAHIIPESFFRGLRGEKKPIKIISNTPGIYPKRTPVGVYDENILCRECEDKFQEIDNYGHKILIANELQHEKLYQNRKLVGYKIHNVNQKLLKLFFISILWRASISTHYFYSKVDLGKLENQAKELIWNMHTGGDDDFSFVLSRFDDDLAGRSILDPHKERWFGVNYYRFYLYGFTLYIKSDSQRTPKKWQQFMPIDDSLIVISRGNIKRTKEYPLMVQTANMRQNA
ncbi:hypothetical protein DSLASN_42780 [Desulfoluna limicola]|uniref:HNH endonuclease 5 domain-containing protein n=1 Tax=Desulfoluna limicola TaxID=2810562 RepID=A0ABM7PM93_9BACT|nr:hypothetical protein [Desulfoluna limicola]BCS98646.1 hypothetical protein DSLASN_42780 [Desulfoluna limicola]